MNWRTKAAFTGLRLLGKHRRSGAEQAAGSPRVRPPGEAANRPGGAQASWGSNGVWPQPSLLLWVFSNHTENKHRAEYSKAMKNYFVNSIEGERLTKKKKHP